jgi:hypothetical protein
MRLLDYSFARPDPAKIKAEGFGGVMRYLSHSASKNLTAGERDALYAQGLGIGLVWETTANRALDGYNAGVADAKDALAQASALNFNGVIYLAVDFDATPQQQDAINNYINGAKSVGGDRIAAAYGGYWVIKRLFDAGIIKWGWQTYAWSGGNWDSRAQLRQVKNGQWNDSVDFNESTTDNWGGQFGQTINNEVANMQGKVVGVAPSILNIRQSADKSSKDLGDLQEGSIINIYEESNGWYRTDGGWVSAQYVEKIVNTPPVTPPPATDPKDAIIDQLRGDLATAVSQRDAMAGERDQKQGIIDANTRTINTLLGEIQSLKEHPTTVTVTETLTDDQKVAFANQYFENGDNINKLSQSIKDKVIAAQPKQNDLLATILKVITGGLIKIEKRK